MKTALKWANELGPVPSLPRSLKDVDKCANLVRAINTQNFVRTLLADSYKNLSYEEKQNCLYELTEISKEYLPDVNDAYFRANVSLRLWSGCLSGAKTISLKTLDGPNTPEKRVASNKYIENIAKDDVVYRAGAVASYTFKKIIGEKEDCRFDGLPSDSILLKEK